MISAQRKRDLLDRAQKLADELANGSVTRAELRPVLNALFLPPLPWPQRFDAANRLLEALPESWVSKRSGKTRPQLARVRGALRPLFREMPVERELAFLLGWTARLLQVKTVESAGKTLDEIRKRQIR
jgi:hypothetical protein